MIKMILRRFEILFFFLVLLNINVEQTSAAIPAKEVSHEDIRDAILSLVRMIRGTEDKLERHESREKVLGDQLKKALANLDKKHKSLEPLKGAISRLDERLSNVETILIQKDEREKQEAQKNNDLIKSIQEIINAWTSNITSMVKAEISHIKIQPLDTSALDTKIKKMEEGLDKKINSIHKVVDEVKEKVGNIKLEPSNNVNNNQCKESNLNESSLNKITNQINKTLDKYTSELSDYNSNIDKLLKESNAVKHSVEGQVTWQNSIISALDKQQVQLKDLRKDIQNNEVLLHQTPNKNEINDIFNQTQKLLQEIKYDSINSNDKDAVKLSQLINNLEKQNQIREESIIKSIASAESETQNIHSQVLQQFELLKFEIQSLSKGEKVMLQTADNVLDTKRRIEYGVHQILLEVGELIKGQSSGLNSTITKKIDDIQSLIVNSQVGALTNLTSKIEYEISQVWRQMGIMHQQVTASNTALDKLQTQTDKYVNGSVVSMDNMKGKVTMITTKMSEVDDNLNYLLGRLSLVTQEFNKIKIGLGDALDNIKQSFLTVQSKIKEAGPGPHNIQKSEENDNEDVNKQ